MLASSIAWAAIAGVAFAIVAALVALLIAHLPLLRSATLVPDAIPYLAAIAAFSVGAAGWWVIVERPHRPTAPRAVLVGALTGLFAHPVLWVLVFAYRNPSAFLDVPRLAAPQAGESPLLAAFLFTYFSALVVGPLTIGIGVFVSLGLVAGRRRTVDRTLRGGESGFFWLNTALLVVLVLLGTPFGSLLGGRGALLVLAAGLAGTAVTTPLLGWLPVVRTSLTRLASHSPTDGAPEPTDFSFVLPCSASLTGFAGVYVLVSLVYILTAESLFRSGFLTVFEGASFLVSLGYPVAVVSLCLPVVLAVEYYRNRWEPATSTRQAILEWSAFLTVTVGVYTLVWIGWLQSSSVGLLD
jgi:hypothetical protein